jgi:hypothetical protein
MSGFGLDEVDLGDGRRIGSRRVEDARSAAYWVAGGWAQIQVSSHILASQSACGIVCPV